MSTFSFNLKDGINNTNNPSLDGIFSYGWYTDLGVFTLFDTYNYTNGNPFTGLPFDSSQELGWKNLGQGYPHIGFENLNPNSQVQPQPFPVNGIYIHPYASSGSRKDVGVRLTVPFNLGGNFTSTVETPNVPPFTDGTGYRILKNGIEILSRINIIAGDPPVVFNNSDSFMVGDTIDFIVDSGLNFDPSGDDTSLQVVIDFTYSQIPTPTILTNPVNCNTTTINGEVNFIAPGTIANLYNGATLLQGVPITITGYTGNFSFTGLNLTTFAGNILSVILTKTGDTDSVPVSVPIENVGCVFTADAVDDIVSTTTNTSINLNLSSNDIPCNAMATTTFQIATNPTSGTLGVLNSTTGQVSYTPNNNYVGNDSFTYNILCDGNIVDTATVTITIASQTGVIDITNNTGGLPALTKICGQTEIYKAPIVFTPALPVVSPVTYLWTVPSGVTIISGQSTDTVNLQFAPNQFGNRTITIQATTPFEVLTKSIIVLVSCADAVNDTFTTTVNVPVTIQLAGNDQLCN